MRRAGLGVIRLVRENQLRLPLRALIETASSAFSNQEALLGLQRAERARKELESATNMPLGRGDMVFRDGWDDPAGNALASELLDFLADRLRVQLRAEGARHDILAAVFAAGADDDLVRLLARTEAVRAFLETDAGTNLLAAAKRAQNILRIEEKKDGAPFSPGFTASLAAPEQERALAEALAATSAAVAETLAAENFAGAMAAMAQLRTPLDAFFEHVTVNDPNGEIRHNRLQLLSALRSVLDQVADFSKIEG